MRHIPKIPSLLIVLMSTTCLVGLPGPADTAVVGRGPLPGEWAELDQLTAPDAEADDEFGFSVGIDGNTLVVGAYLEDAVGSNSGAAYVYRRDPGGPEPWVLVKEILGSDTAGFDGFGSAVAVNGDRIVVGAYHDDHSSEIDPGSAYVFERNEGGAENWGEVAKLISSEPRLADEFGISVAIDGERVVVGAVNALDDLNVQSGVAEVFERDQGGPGSWGRVARLSSTDGESFDLFGQSVAVSGDTVVVGADQGDDVCPEEPLCNSGAAFVFQQNAGGADNWGQVQKLLADDAIESAHFGISVAVDGDTAAVGANRDAGVASESGSVYVYARDEGGADQWGQVIKLIPSDAEAVDQAGYSVALSGGRLLMGAWLDDDLGTSSGSAYLFERQVDNPQLWTEIAKLLPGDGEAEDRFGVAVDLDGDTAVIGSYRNDGACPGDPSCNSGSAYIFFQDNSIFADGFESGDPSAWSACTGCL